MTDNTANNKRIAKNTLFMSIRMVVVFCITLYTTREVLATLGIVDYGIFNVVGGFVLMFSFLNTSLSNGIQRFYNYELGKRGESGAKAVYNTAVTIQWFVAIVLVLVIEIVGVWYIESKMVIPSSRLFAAQCIFQAAVLSFFCLMIQVPYSASVIAHERMGYYAFVSILDAILKVAILFLLQLFDYDKLIVYGILYSFISLVNFALYFFYAKHNFQEIKIDRVLLTSRLKSMLSFSGWNIFGTFSIMMKDQFLNLILNLFFGPIVNAARGIASQVNWGVQSMVANITVPVRPQVVKSYAMGDEKRTLNLTYFMCKFSCLFFFMIAYPICLEVDYILKLWLGQSVPAHTGSFVIIVLATAFTGNLHSAISNLVHATGVMRRFQLYTSIVKLLSVPIAYVLLVCGYSAEVALIVVLVVDIVTHMVGCFIVKTIIVFSVRNYIYRVIVPITVVLVFSAIIPIVPYLLMSPSFLRLIIVVLTSALSTVVFGYCFALSSIERCQLNSILKRK